MKGRNNMIFAIISGIVIFGVSIFVAYICFNILKSSASANLKEWKLGGAFAGFVFTALLLTSITFQIYKQLAADLVSEYLKEIQELRLKVIKGAPCPSGYTIELDEKHKFVFARPQKWLFNEGILYQYVDKRANDIIPANFNVIYQSTSDLSEFFEANKLGTFDPDNMEVEKLYDIITNGTIAAIRQYFNPGDEHLLKEYVIVDGYKSLKWVYSYTRIESDGKNEIKIRMCQSAVYTFVPKLKALYEFTFTDNEEDYLISSEVFSNVERSIRFL